jgi:hypothetical protein
MPPEKIKTCSKLQNYFLKYYPFTRVLSLLSRPSPSRKALPRFYLCIFISLFSEGNLLRWKVPARLYWDHLTSGTAGTRQPVTISKSEKISALLCVGKVGKGPEYRPFSDFQPIASAYRP